MPKLPVADSTNRLYIHKDQDFLLLSRKGAFALADRDPALSDPRNALISQSFAAYRVRIGDLGGMG